MGRPGWVSDVIVGDWNAPRLRNLDGTVASAVPTGFDAYARVMHPVDPTEAVPDRWSDVCAATGAPPHALMQWRVSSRTEEVQLPSGSWTRTMAWSGGELQEGVLAAGALRALLDVLAGHTRTAARCWFALWEGWGWLPAARRS
jgi:hypothetical protein